MKDIIILAVLVGGYSAAVFYAGYTKGEASIVSQAQSQTIKEITHEAQSFARRPHTADDLIDELCRRGIAAAKNDRTANRELLSECRARIQGGE